MWCPHSPLPFPLFQGFLPVFEGVAFEAQGFGPKLGTSTEDSVHLPADNQLSDWAVCAAGDGARLAPNTASVIVSGRTCTESDAYTSGTLQLSVCLCLLPHLDIL